MGIIMGDASAAQRPEQGRGEHDDDCHRWSSEIMRRRRLAAEAAEWSEIFGNPTRKSVGFWWKLVLGTRKGLLPLGAGVPSSNFKSVHSFNFQSRAEIEFQILKMTQDVRFKNFIFAATRQPVG